MYMCLSVLFSLSTTVVPDSILFFQIRPHAHAPAHACGSVYLFAVALSRKLCNFANCMNIAKLLSHPDFSDDCKFAIIVLQV